MGCPGRVAIFAALLIGGCVSHRPDVVETLWSLPEIVEWAGRVRSASKGEVRPCSRDESTVERWEFTFGEDHPDHLVPWNRFSVDRSSGAISVWSFSKDEWIGLEEWRRTR